MKAIVVGGGQLGSYVASLLREHKMEVTVLDNREDSLEKVKGKLPDVRLVNGSGSDPDTLEAAGIQNTDVFLAVTGKDEVNLVASTVAKFEFGVPRVIARVNNPQNAWLFNKDMGVDQALNQAELLAHIAIDEIDMQSISTLMRLKHNTYSIVRVIVHAGSAAIGKTVRELPIPEKALLISVYRADQDEVLIPRGDTVIQQGDNVLLLTDDPSRQALEKLFQA